MTPSDLLQDLLSSNPNDPASKGSVLLIHAEMRSEFRSLRQDMDQRFGEVNQRLNRLESSVQLIAENVATLVAR